MLGGFCFSSSLDDVESDVLRICEISQNDSDVLSYLNQQDDDVKFYFLALLNLNGSIEGATSRLANFYLEKTIEVTNDKYLKSLAYKSLADSFYSGDGIDESLSLAQYYYKKAAQLNLASAMFNLSVVYSELKQMKKARYWMQKYLLHKNAELKERAIALMESW